MIARIWRTGVEPTRVGEYERFAVEQSLPMFRQHRGCLGVLFGRASSNCAVITLWDDLEAIAALENSDSYLGTVARIMETGFLSGDQSVEVLDVHGGELTAAAAQVLSSG